jgi:maltose alpha-D-glucosyltransferase/alpha-amylase
MQMMFNFHVNQNLFYALATADTGPLVKALNETKQRPASAQWGLFLRNHDELDLGRLTKAQQKKVFDAFGADKDMQLYDRGIRRRLAPMLGADRRKIELAYSLMYTLPGTPVLRYGDEIGMGDNLKLPERNCARTPMQWSNEPQAGFTKGAKPCLPVISKGPFGFQQINAAKQRRDPNSLLNWMERTIRMRKEVPEMGRFPVHQDPQSVGPDHALRVAQQRSADHPQFQGRRAGGLVLIWQGRRSQIRADQSALGGA